MSEATLSILSVGQIASQCRAPVARVLKTAEALGITPELKIDSVPHFSEVDAKRIEARLCKEDRN